MPENFALYSQTYEALPEEQMSRLAADAEFAAGTASDGGRSFIFRWAGLTVTCNEMPPANVPTHLSRFCGYVKHIYGGKLDERGSRILDRINYTRLVVGVVIEPKRDAEGRAERLLGSMVYGLNALMFHGNALYDKDSKLILAPGGEFDKAADVLGPVAEMIKNRVQVKLPEREPYKTTPDQVARYRRVLAQLNQRKAPTLSYALHIEDDAEATLREPAEVARRAVVLSAVTLLADGGPRDKALAIIGSRNLWPAVSPKEEKFLRAEEADEQAARKLLWRLEGLWVLAWALGDVELDWPAKMCDVPRLVGVLQGYEADAEFVTEAKLRPTVEILDAVQLTMLIHWAIRDAWIHKRPIPENLDWVSGAKMAPVSACPAAGVVEERHRALNWLIRFNDADWDDVDTPT
jgi:hypothetical protein